MVKMESVWRATSEFLSDNVAIVLPIAIAAIFVPATISQTLQPLEAQADASLQLVFALLTVAFTLLSVWAQAAIIALAIDPALGRKAGQAGLRRLPAIIGVGLVLLIALVVLALPIAIILAIGGGGWSLAAETAQMPSATSLALAVLYGLILLVAPVVVGERRGLGAIRRAWRLTRGRTATIVGLVILYAVIVIVAQLAMKTVLGSVLLLFLGDDGGISVASVLTAIGVGLVIMIFTVLQAAFLAKLYIALIDPAELNAAVPA